nr:CRN effector protein [Phytophthora cinnamomi]
MVWLLCVIVGQPGAVFGIEIDGALQVLQLKSKIKHEKATFKDVAAKNLHLFLAKTDGEWLASNGSAVRQMRTGDIPAQVKGMLTKEIDPGAQIGAVFRDAPQYDHIHVLVRKGGDMVELQNSLEWREPNPLCKSFGKAWPYQGKEELAATVAGPLADHFNAWKDGNDDKQTHAINLVLSGPGTGKSRMLDEMDGILLRAAELSGSQELVRRMQKVYIFHVTFENGTAAHGSLINPENPDYDVSYRMLYQLTKDRRTDWPAFCYEMKRLYGHFPLSIGTVISMLADMEMTDVENATVVLCVDGLQKLMNDKSKVCDLKAKWRR